MSQGVSKTLNEENLPKPKISKKEPSNYLTSNNVYSEEYKNYLNTYHSPTFKSTPIFKPEERPPLYRSNIDYTYHQKTNLPHLANYEKSITLPPPPEHPKSEDAKYKVHYPLNKKDNPNMGLEDRFENDPKMYWIWPSSHELLKQSPDPRTDHQKISKDSCWGTHMHEYAGIGGLSFLGNKPKCRDLNVARSHRHYLSGFSYSLHDKITRSHITPFKKSLNRASDDLVPPANLIPLWKFPRLVEQCKFIKEDKYASHINKTEMFPIRCKNQNLSENHENAIQNMVKKRYGQTTYTENFYDQRATTSLKLGPQFQFYDSDTEVTEEETQTIEKGQENNISTSTSKTITEGETESNEATSKVSKTSNLTSKTDSAETAETTQTKESESKTSTKSNLSSEIERPVINDPSTKKTAAWPAWPGNRCNHIDPVTLKIAEKTDVNCLQDKNDVKALKQSYLLKQPDYVVPENLDHAPTAAAAETNFEHKFAPAYVDFAYSGVPGYYGCEENRNNQINFIDLKEKLTPHPRHKALPKHLNSNVNRFINPYYVETELSPKESSSIEELNNTLNNLREPTEEYDPINHQPKLHRKKRKNDRLLKRSQTGIEKQQKCARIEENEENIRTHTAPAEGDYNILPPLWETLDYTSNRLTDQLGVRFKSAAQARYHNLYPESRYNKVSSPFSNLYLKQDDRHTTYRRQYYNGHHMGSSFR